MAGKLRKPWISTLLLLTTFCWILAPFAVLAAPAVAAVNPTRTVILKEGTPVLLRTTKELKSGKDHEGSLVRYAVARDVLGKDKHILVEYEAGASGKVTVSKKRGMFGKNGKLEFTVENVEAVDGTQVPLRASEATSGKNNAGVVVAAVLFLTIFAVFVNGRDVTIPEGTEIAAYVDRDTKINLSPTAQIEEAPRGAPVESVEVKLTNGDKVRKGEPLQVTVLPAPADKAIRLRVVLEGNEKLKRDKDFSTFEIKTKDLAVGSHTLRVEVTFLSGFVVRQDTDFVVE